ncbi:MAG: phosphonate C-P lyase system protein PhnH [Rhodoferax ferrireducens]|uniref:Phosphonate C-P lyase system protein PhnH n=2 Tax=Pseudomonadota TaxID=1224 RepID=A0A1Y1QS35_9GAMM|nr:MAG: phosphonate C-P lyase system protein PhnH [Rhodoferax ferrireducens]OQX12239.1 MAG: phosphonate C-P lyase system protein PhnH [Thiothrix lacustris]
MSGNRTDTKTENLWQGSVQQSIFRELLDAFSRPGEVRDLTLLIEGTTAQRAVLATLMDGEATLADPHQKIAIGDWSLLQARRGTPEAARYVVIDGCRAPDFEPAMGCLESPEFGATLLIEVTAVGDGPLVIQLNGPGINGLRVLRLDGLHADWLEQRVDWVASFPLGVDILFFDSKRIVALPRTTHVGIATGVI